MKSVMKGLIVEMEEWYCRKLGKGPAERGSGCLVEVTGLKTGIWNRH